jgi:glycosyltransferase involved in cell wall biosynthesis
MDQLWGALVAAPSVSVIIPVYNHDRFIGAALTSVLAQTYPPFEIIVVDDGSTDASAVVARSFPGVEVQSQTNAGPSAARNTGIGLARGELLAFLDSDDLWVEHKLAVQVDYLRAHPDVPYVLSQMQNFVDPNCTPPAWCTPEYLAHRQSILGSSLLARRQMFELLGGFDPNIRVYEDLEWLARSKQAGIPPVALPEVLTRRRIHGANISGDPATHHQIWLQLCQHVLRRARQGPPPSSVQPNPPTT